MLNQVRSFINKIYLFSFCFCACINLHLSLNFLFVIEIAHAGSNVGTTKRCNNVNAYLTNKSYTVNNPVYMDSNNIASGASTLTNQLSSVNTTKYSIGLIATGNFLNCSLLLHVFSLF